MPGKMTVEELVAKILECHSEGTEEGHMSADLLLLEFIDEPKVTEAFNSLGKWYS